MDDHDIQKSKQLLKRLEEEMDFLRSITSQIENLSSQAIILSATIKRTWNYIDQVHKSWKLDIDES
jgi:hypothetical protein